jgi:hypothetical protein
LIGEILGQALGEYAFYGTGRVVAMMFTPHIGVPPFSDKRSEPPSPWYALTFDRNGKRFYRIEGLLMLGVLFWAAAVALFLVGWWMNGL